MPPAHRAQPLPTTKFRIGPRLDRADIPGLCERAQRQMEGIPAERLNCDVSPILDPDAVTVDALARLQLTARRLGRHIRVEHASPTLRELLALMGLSGVVPLGEPSGLEARRQPEEREQRCGVEEERDSADPAV
jgi:ABC-type transporter Mla MlaB component